MLEWLQQFMQPENADAIAALLAQKSAPPQEVLATLPQNIQNPAPARTPLNPGVGGFEYALNGDVDPNFPMLPPPQSGYGPNFENPTIQPPTQQPSAGVVPPQPDAQPRSPLSGAQWGSLLPEQEFRQISPPSAPGLVGGHGVNAAQFLSTATPQQRRTLAELLMGRG